MCLKSAGSTEVKHFVCIDSWDESVCIDSWDESMVYFVGRKDVVVISELWDNQTLNCVFVGCVPVLSDLWDKFRCDVTRLYL